MRQILQPTILGVGLLSVMAAGPAVGQVQADSHHGDEQKADAATASPPAPQAAASRGPDDQTVELDQVKVTASRREQRLQEVPMSITDISAAELGQMQVRRLDDIRFVTPNVVMQQNTGTSSGAKVFIRGVGTDDSIFTADPAVAIYIDDVYIARETGAMLDLYDVERVEVLRGPQGTLYGRNATGGAIRYITKKPDGKSRFKVDTNFGNYGRASASAKMSGRFGESVDYDVAVMHNARDGILHDVANHRMVNDQDVSGARMTLASYWGENSFATLTVDALRERSTPAFAAPVEPGPDGHGVRPVLGSYYRTESDIAGLNKLDQSGIALTSNSQFNWGTWRSILHYRKLHNELYMDMDGTDQPLLHVYQDQHQNQYGYEGQFTSEGEGPISWVGGVFLFRERNSQPTRQDVFVPGPTNYMRLDTKAAAAYGQATWSITDNLRLVGGFRYSYEHKAFDVRQAMPDGTPGFTKHLSDKWTRPDWKFVVNYDFTDNIMGYLSYTTGFKSGSFNGRGTTYATITPVDEETMKAYEAGMKSMLFDNRVRFNIDYYRLDYGSLQLSALNRDGVFTLTNATGALIQGVEAQLDAQVTDRFSFGASIGTVDARYQDITPGNEAYYRGRSLKDAPKLQGTLHMKYVQPLPGADLTFTLQSRYTDSYYQNQEATPLIMTHANNLVNARIAYTHHNPDWSIALWGKNLTNKYYTTGGFYVPDLGVATSYPNEPRTYGVEWSYRFW